VRALSRRAFVLCVCGGGNTEEEGSEQQEEGRDQRAAPEEEFDSEEEDLDDFIVYGPDEEQERRKARKERRQHAGALGVSQSQLEEAASIFGGDMSEFLQNQFDDEEYEVNICSLCFPPFSFFC
jgi:hypothetical protein